MGGERPGEQVEFLIDHLRRRPARCHGFDPHRPPIRPTTGFVIALFGVEPDTRLDHLRQRPVEHTCPPLSVDPLSRLEPVGDLPEDVEVVPDTLALRQRRHDLDDHGLRRLSPCATGSVHGVDHRPRRVAEISGLLPPGTAELCGGIAGLLHTRVRRRFTLDRSTFEPRRMTALACFELLDPGIRFDVDLGGALGEHGEQLRVETGDLGLAVHDRLPPDTEPRRQLGAEHRLIQATEGALVLLQHPRIQRHPPPIRRLDLRRHHEMRVDLRVIQPRRRLPEPRHRQPDRVQMQPATVRADTRRCRPPLQRLNDRTHRDVMTLQQPVITRERPQHRQRLRSRQRCVEPRHRLHDPTIARRPIRQRPPETPTRYGIQPGEERLQLLAVDVPDQPEAVGLGAHPHPGNLTRRRRQILRVIRSRRRRRRRIQRGHTHHDTSPPQTGTCLSNQQPEIPGRRGWEVTSEGRSVLAARLGVSGQEC